MLNHILKTMMFLFGFTFITHTILIFKSFEEFKSTKQDQGYNSKIKSLYRSKVQQPTSMKLYKGNLSNIFVAPDNLRNIIKTPNNF